MQRSLPLVGFALLALATFWVYAPGLGGGFIFDDYPNLLLDPDWKLTRLGWTDIERAMAHGVSSSGGRPLAMLTFALNHYLAALDPWTYKATNLAMHVVTGVFVFLLLSRLLELALDEPRRGYRRAWALVGSGIWLLHPLQASTTLYVVQRMEIGAQMFAVAAVLAYVTARVRQQEGRPASAFFVIAVVAVVLGLGFKESAALTPVYVGLIELTLLGFRGRTGTSSRVLQGVFVAGAVAALLAFVTVITSGAASPEAYASRDFTLAERLLTQPRVLMMYLGQILVPDPERLVFYYDHLSPSTGLLRPLSTLASIAALLGMLGCAFLARTKRPLVALGIAWFFAAHLLTSNVFPLELAFEHRNYLALLGPVIAMIGVLEPRLRRYDRVTSWVSAAAALVGLAWLTRVQAAIWGDPFELAMTLDMRNPQSPRAVYALGTHFHRMSGDDARSPLWSLARRQFEQAAAIPGSGPLGDQGLIVLMGRARQVVPPAAWNSLRAKLRHRRAGPEEEMALYEIVSCRTGGACDFDDGELYATLLTALEANPRSDVVHVQYASFAYNVMRDPELAARTLEAAVLMNPRDPTLRLNLLRIRLASNLLTPSQAALEIEALQRENRDGRLDDGLAELKRMLGRCLRHRNACAKGKMSCQGSPDSRSSSS